MTIEPASLVAFTPGGWKTAKAILEQFRRIASHNNAMADGAFRDAMDDIAAEGPQNLEQLERVVERLVEMVVHREGWHEEPERERPTTGDIITRADEFARASWKAGSHGKRRVLWNAFFSSFKPSFYRTGWSTHMWRIAEQIEYPECRLLAELIRMRESRKENPSVVLPVFAPEHEKHFLAHRLEMLGLVQNELSDRRIRPSATDVGRRFQEFVWDDEMWRDIE